MDAFNKLADKAERAAEKMVNQIEDKIDNATDAPVEPMPAGNFPTGSSRILCQNF